MLPRCDRMHVVLRSEMGKNSTKRKYSVSRLEPLDVFLSILQNCLRDRKFGALPRGRLGLVLAIVTPIPPQTSTEQASSRYVGSRIPVSGNISSPAYRNPSFSSTFREAPFSG